MHDKTEAGNNESVKVLQSMLKVASEYTYETAGISVRD